MQFDLSCMVYGLWIALVAIWVLSAIRSKRTARSQSGGSRLLQGGLTALGYLALFYRSIPLGVLDRRFVPGSALIEWIGFAIALAGAVAAVWARFALGRNWSATITLKQEHELVRRGPYALVRHPIYSGLLLTMSGTAIFFGTFRGLLAVALAFAGWWLKSRMEEAFMLQQFGQQYREYQSEVKALIPFVL
ncbi:MAG: isoprenylcysteine carboxylmethyltransferase family protein [Bryobacterales bacterium]|nr:isoprenylcysteine carboxylmethyltransferase family protein [Bryobacterales bacterium]